MNCRNFLQQDPWTLARLVWETEKAPEGPKPTPTGTTKPPEKQKTTTTSAAEGLRRKEAAKAGSPNPADAESLLKEGNKTGGLDTSTNPKAFNDTIETAMKRYSSLAKEKGDFKTDDAFQTTYDGLQKFLGSYTGEAPLPLLNAWIKAAVAFMVLKVSKYNWRPGQMGIEEAEKAVKELNDEIGSFEKWIVTSPLKPQYEKWKNDKAAEEVKKAEAEKAAAAASAAKKSTENETQPDGESPPQFDALLAEVEKWEDGKWKTFAQRALSVFGAFIAMISQWPLVGKYVQGFMSNESLAKYGDEKVKTLAAVAIKVEGEFKKFHLPKKFANALGNMKTSEVIKLIKDPEKLKKLTTDEKHQEKFLWLAEQLVTKGGENSSESLFQFMGKWTDVIYEKPSPTPAAAPSTVPETPAKAETPPAPANQ